MLRYMFILPSVWLVSLGWFSSDLDVKIRFDQINGLKAEARVLFEQNRIGNVTDVVYEKSGTYLVDVEIDSDFKEAVTENSRFFIVKDPSDSNEKIIEMITVKGKGRPLEDGAVVKGATRVSAFLEKVEDDVSGAIGDLKQQFRRFSEDLKKVPEDEDIKKLQKDLDQLLDEMKRSGAEFRDKVQKDLMPKLQEEIDKLKERLRQSGREKEVEPLQIRMDEIRNI